MANYEFSPMYLQYYMNFLHFLVNHRWLWEILMSSIAVFTLVFEVGFPIFMLLAYLVKKPWARSLRWFVIGAAVMLHLGIAIFMGLVTFSLMMLVAVCAFVPAEAWHRLFERLHLEDGRIRLAYVEGKAA
jgi:hypothetical protein